MESIPADDTFARLPITKDREEIPFPQRTGRLCSNVVLIYRAPWYLFQYGGGVRKESSLLLQEKFSFLFDLYLTLPY